MIESSPSDVVNSLNNNFESVSVYWWQHFWYKCVMQCDVWSITVKQIIVNK